MKKIALAILISACVGCAGLQPPPEAQRVIPVNSTRGCRFIRDMYLRTSPDTTPEMLHSSLQWHTYKAGGDAYRILSQVRNFDALGPFSRRLSPEPNLMGESAITTHFEILKCNP